MIFIKIIKNIYNIMEAVFFNEYIESVARVMVSSIVLLFLIDNGVTDWSFTFMKILLMLWSFKPIIKVFKALLTSEDKK